MEISKAYNTQMENTPTITIQTLNMNINDNGNNNKEKIRKAHTKIYSGSTQQCDESNLLLHPYNGDEFH